MGVSVSHAGQVAIDSGIINPELPDAAFDDGIRKLWPKAKLRPRAEAIIAHELAEHECSDHEPALIAAATELPISHAAREPLGQMEEEGRGR